MKSIIFIQYGDFREAYQRFAAGAPESYRDQKRSVDFVASLAPDARTTTVTLGGQRYRAELAKNLWVVGLENAAPNSSEIARALDDAAPSHVILRTPHLGFLREIRRRKLPLLPTFADIFKRRGARAMVSNFMIRRELARCDIPCISNHSLNASWSLVDVLGLPPEKIVPWDWSEVPLGGPPKSGVRNPMHPTAFFAGNLTSEKGVGDCLNAIAELKRIGRQIAMTFAGPGDIQSWEMMASNLGISENTRFLGVISNQEVRQEMREHDFVIVPSRHSYDEGLPNTIYEGLSSRSVLIISDHPAFVGRLEPGKEALIFPEKDFRALARLIKLAIENTELYSKISRNSQTAHEKLYVGIEWTSLVELFLNDKNNESGWVDSYNLKSVVTGNDSNKENIYNRQL